MTHLPQLTTIRDLSEELIDSYRVDGHVCVRGLAAPEEIAAYRPAIEGALHRAVDAPLPLEERDTYGRAFLQGGGLWHLDVAVRQFVTSPRFAKAAADFMGVGGVRLYHDQGLFKEPGGGRTPWHQDQYYWPLATSHTITMWMPLVDVPAEVGSMSFVTGSHLRGDIGAGEISDRSDAAISAHIRDDGLTFHTHGAMRAGDATFHAGWVLHSAPPNRTDMMRSVMTVIYVVDGALVAEPAHAAQRHDKRTWLGDLTPGAPVSSADNPLLWPATESTV